MSGAPDVRSLTHYELQKSDLKFIRDSCYNVVGSRDYNERAVRDLVSALTEEKRAKCCRAGDVALAACDLIIAHNKSFSQCLALARVLGCENNLNRDENGIYVSHECSEYFNKEELEGSIMAWIEKEFDKVDKAREELDNDMEKKIKYMALAYVIDNDSSGLGDFLSQLPKPRSPLCNGKCNCQVCKPTWAIPTIEDALLATDKRGFTPLQWAAELRSPECISVILKNAQRHGEKLLLDVLHAVKNEENPLAVFISVFWGDVECISVFLEHVDFTTACVQGSISVLEYLVHLASNKILGATYLPILKVVLEYIRNYKPDYNLNTPIHLEEGHLLCQRRGDESGESESEEEEEEEEDLATALAESAAMQREEETEEGEELETTPNDGGEETSNDNPNDDIGEGEGDGDVLPRPSRRPRRRRVRDYYDDYYVNEQILKLPGFPGPYPSRAVEDLVTFGFVGRERAKLSIHRYILKDEEEWNDVSWTLLSISVTMSAVEVVQLLLEYGASPNYTVPSPSRGGGCSGTVAILCYAIRSYYEEDDFNRVGCLATLQVLLDNGADINAKEPKTKNTALITAATYAVPKVLVFLLKAGAITTIRNAEGKTAYDLVERNYPELAELLLRKTRLQRLLEVIAEENESRNTNTSAGASADEDSVPVEVPENLTCGICWENERCITLAPCGHRKLCKGCALKVLGHEKEKRRCPFCKSIIESYIMQIYD